MKVLIDTNILLRFFLDSELTQGKKASILVKKIEQGQVRGIISLLVINEYVWVINKYYKMKKDEFIPPLVNFLSINGVKVLEIPNKFMKQVLTFYQERNFDLTDCYLSKVAELKKIQVASFDQDLKKLETPLYKWE